MVNLSSVSVTFNGKQPKLTFVFHISMADSENKHVKLFRGERINMAHRGPPLSAGLYSDDTRDGTSCGVREVFHTLTSPTVQTNRTSVIQ